MTSDFQRPLGLIAAAVLAASPAAACTAEETPMPSQAPIAPQVVASVEQVYGLWSIQDGDGRCRIALSANRRGVGHQASVERCTLPVMAEAALWRPVVGGFELLGAGDRVLARFRLTGVDTFESPDGRLKGERAVEL